MKKEKESLNPGLSPKVLGIVPARKGSKRLAKKNMLPIGDVSLAERAYKTLKRSKCNKVIIATDILDLLKDPKIYTIRRPERLNDDKTPVQDVLEWLLEAFSHYEIAVMLFPTNPLIDYTDVDKAIDMVSGGRFNIVRSYNYDTGEENGLYVVEINYFLRNDYLYDVYTGMINCAGKEIHTMEEYKLIKRLLEGGYKKGI